MSGFNPVNVNIAVGEDGASHRADANGLLFDAHLGQHFGYELMHHTVTASWAVVHRGVIEQLGAREYEVFVFDYFVSFHFFKY